MFVFCGSLIARADAKMWSKDIQQLLILCCVNLYFVFAGGGRSALVIAVVSMFYFAIRSKQSFLQKVRPYSFGGVGHRRCLDACGGVFTLQRFCSERWKCSRQIAVLESASQTFFRKSFFGQGHFWLDAFRRLQFRSFGARSHAR